MESASYKVLDQIKNNKYVESLKKDGFRKFIKSGVAFYKKECIIKEYQKKNKSMYSKCFLLIFDKIQTVKLAIQ